MPTLYEIRVKGHLDPRWAEWLGNAALVQLDTGETVICSEVSDQAELHGLLNRIRDLNIQLVSVKKQDDPNSW